MSRWLPLALNPILLSLMLLETRKLQMAAMAASPVPPFAPPRQHLVSMPNGKERDDPYFWLRDDNAKDPDVLDYLNAENDYAAAILKPNADLENRLIDDMDRRVPRVETTAPEPSESLSYWYGSSRGPGQDYWVYSRRPAAPGSALPLGGATPRTPLSYGPDLTAGEQTVLDINQLARGFKYCDVGAVKPSPDGRYVAFTVDTVGNEEYELVVQEIGSGRRVPIAGGQQPSKTAPVGGLPGVAAHVEWTADSSAVLALVLTVRTHEAYQLVRVRLLPPATSTQAAAEEKPEVLLQDDKSGAVLEMLGPTSCGRFMVVSRSYQGGTTLLALTLPPAGSPPRPKPATQPKKGIPAAVKLLGSDPWVLIAPESSRFDVLRADHLHGDGKGKETFAVLLDSDKYPDGHVAAVTNGDLKGRTVLIPGKKGRQIVDIVVAGGCVNGASSTNNSSSSSSTAAATGSTGQYLVVHTLEDMVASVDSYDISGLRTALSAVRGGRRARRQHRRMLAAAAGKPGADMDNGAGGDHDPRDSDGGDGSDIASDSDEERDRQVVAKAAAEAADGVAEVDAARRLGESPALLPAPWTWAPGPEISSLSLDRTCWPGTVPYVRLSYSCMTTPLTTMDLDLATGRAYKRMVERVEDFDPARYRSQTLWATAPDGTLVPVTVAGRADAWPAETGTPLPAILQLYGAYGRKLLPDFIPGDLAIMDGVPEPSPSPPVSGPGTVSAGSTTSSSAGAGGGGGDGGGGGSAVGAPGYGPGPVLMVLAHVRGGGELGSYWHVEGKRLRKNNTATDFCAVVAMLVERGYVRPGALAVWGRSAGGLAAGMALHRCPPGTFRAALLDVPFVDVLGSMTDPSLPLTIKERPEWGDPTASQEDYDNILSYSPYDNVGPVALRTPALLATCSLYDPRVPYWGPAKYIARLRAAMAAQAAPTSSSSSSAAATSFPSSATSSSSAASSPSPSPSSSSSPGPGGPVMLLTEMGAGGHFSASGASGRLAERAMRAAFMLAEMRKAMAGLGPATATATAAKAGPAVAGEAEAGQEAKAAEQGAAEAKAGQGEAAAGSGAAAWSGPGAVP